MVSGVQGDGDGVDGGTDSSRCSSYHGWDGLEVVDLPDQTRDAADPPPQCSPHLSDRQVEMSQSKHSNVS